MQITTRDADDLRTRNFQPHAWLLSLLSHESRPPGHSPDTLSPQLLKERSEDHAAVATLGTDCLHAVALCPPHVGTHRAR